jgi:peptide/nickel transport system substrate-binding protein
VVPNGTDTCIRPGTAPSDCGPGVARGAKLSFTALYEDTATWVGKSMAQWKSDASKVGIQISLTSGPFSTIYGETTPCKPSQPACSWQISNFDGIENYAYPVGALFFSSNGALNYGSYVSAKVDALIEKTTVDSSPAAMQAYDAYLAQQVPMIWFPNPVDSLDEISNKLGGTTTTRHGEAWTTTPPEYWYFKS